MLVPRIIVTTAFSLLCFAIGESSAVLDQVGPPLITPEVEQLVQNVLVNGSIPGMALGIVRLDGTVESRGFGIKTEDGAEMTPDVRAHPSSRWSRLVLIY
jgi:hypothetical protein